MSKDETLDLIGKILPKGYDKRDAIHIAVLPVKVGSVYLSPGEYMTLNKKKEAVSASEPRAIGIIDPFLRLDAKKGDTVFCFLKPGTVTGLRHVWTHPDLSEEEVEQPQQSKVNLDSNQAFLAKIAENPDDEAPYGVYADWLEGDGNEKEAKYYRNLPKRRKEAKAWMEEFVESINGGDGGLEEYYTQVTVEKVLDAAKVYQMTGESEMYFNNTSAQELFSEKQSEFWDHFAVLSGIPVTNREWFWRCGC